MIIEVDIPFEQKDPVLMKYLFKLTQEFEEKLEGIKRVLLRWEEPFMDIQSDLIIMLFTTADTIEVNWKAVPVRLDWAEYQMKETQWIEEYFALCSLEKRIMVEVWPFDEHYREYM